MEWYVWIILAALLGNIAVLFRKKALFHEHAMEFTGFRAMVTLPLLVALSFFADLSITINQGIFLFVLASLGALGIVIRNHVFRHHTVSHIAPLSGVGNIFVLFFGVMFLGEFPTFVQLGGILIIISGLYVLEFNHKSIFEPFRKIKNTPFIHQYLSAALLFSITLVGSRQLLQTLSPMTVMFYIWLFIAIQIIVVEIAMHGTHDMKDFKKEAFAITAAAVLMFGGNILSYIGLAAPEAQAVLVKSVGGLGAVMLTLVGGKFFHEGNLARKSLASGIIVAGGLLVIL